MDEQWQTVFEVTGPVGSFDGVDVESAFQTRLTLVSKDPQVASVKAEILHEGVTTWPVLGDVANITGYRINVIYHPIQETTHAG